MTFAWLVTALSLVGMGLNIRRNRWCFVVWGVTNVAWIGIDLAHGIPEQAALQGVYLAASLWGWWQWSRPGPH